MRRTDTIKIKKLKKALRSFDLDNHNMKSPFLLLFPFFISPRVKSKVKSLDRKRTACVRLVVVQKQRQQKWEETMVGPRSRLESSFFLQQQHQRRPGIAVAAAARKSRRHLVDEDSFIDKHQIESNIFTPGHNLCRQEKRVR